MHMSQKKFLVLQMNDSLFPIGAYSHSYGLETYIQKGIVKDAETAEKYLKMRLQYNFFYTDFLAVKLSYEAALGKNIQKVEELEDILGASRIPEEIRNASRKSFCEDPSCHGTDLEKRCIRKLPGGKRRKVYQSALCIWDFLCRAGNSQGRNAGSISLRTGFCYCDKLCKNDSFKPVIRAEAAFFPDTFL